MPAAMRPPAKRGCSTVSCAALGVTSAAPRPKKDLGSSRPLPIVEGRLADGVAAPHAWASCPPAASRRASAAAVAGACFIAGAIASWRLVAPAVGGNAAAAI